MDLKADFSLFVRRYVNLQRQFFSSTSSPRFEDGEPIPSAFLDKGQIVQIFQNELKVEIPTSPTDTVIRFIDGSTFDYAPKPQTVPVQSALETPEPVF